MPVSPGTLKQNFNHHIGLFEHLDFRVTSILCFLAVMFRKHNNLNINLSEIDVDDGENPFLLICSLVVLDIEYPNVTYFYRLEFYSLRILINL